MGCLQRNYEKWKSWRGWSRSRTIGSYDSLRRQTGFRDHDCSNIYYIWGNAWCTKAEDICAFIRNVSFDFHGTAIWVDVQFFERMETRIQHLHRRGHIISYQWDADGQERVSRYLYNTSINLYVPTLNRSYLAMFRYRCFPYVGDEVHQILLCYIAEFCNDYSKLNKICAKVEEVNLGIVTDGDNLNWNMFFIFYTFMWTFLNI